MASKLISAKNILTRIGIEFNNEIEDIKQKRKDLDIDKVKKSTRELTDLIVKHRAWKYIKRDTIELKNGIKK